MIDEQEVQRAWEEYEKQEGYHIYQVRTAMEKAFKAGYEAGYDKAATEAAEDAAGPSL